MIRSTKERTAAYELTWSLSTASGAPDGKAHALTLEYQLHALEELYVGDRLWDKDRTGKRMPDPFGVYRFVHDGSLRLVFAQAPYPPNVMPSDTYKPLFSRVRAGETHTRAAVIMLPVDEYSALSRNINAPTVVEEVSRVVLIMSYRLRSAMDRDPVPPPNEAPEGAGYIVHDWKLMVSSLDVEGIPVKRRTGYMARFALPGEPGPAPKPLP